jgi:cytochrome c biogenesis protein CcdA/thiol-disulfide isomerase/thioredoxin
MVLLGISFIAGVLTVLAPCILPLLPVIIGGSLAEGGIGGLNKKKAFTIILSLGASVILFTLLLKASTLFIDIPEYVWKWISGGIIIALGLVTLFPSLWETAFVAKMSTRSNILLGKGDQKKSFWGDVIVGAALGPVFSTCSPTYFIVLATVLPVNFALGLGYLLAYTVGLCLSLLVVALIGQRIMSALGVAADPRGWLKRTLGVLFLIVGVAIIGGFDKKTQLFLLESGFFDVTQIEQKLLQQNTAPAQVPADLPAVAPTDVQALDATAPSATSTVSARDTLSAPKVTAISSLTAAQKNAKYKKVPELSSIDGYVNTEGKPISLASLKGKVVLLDIWTYSCINCQRTLPYINQWYAKYKDQGLVVVGLHTPEFAFEKVQANVEEAVKRFGIKYPVVLDNDYSTWNALGNQFWPRKYLVDIDGYIVYDHIGEGAYDVTEKEIQKALAERAARLGMTDAVPTTTVSLVPADTSGVQSPETYFGSARNQYLGNGDRSVSGVQTFSLPSARNVNKLYLSGVWDITPEYAANASVDATVEYQYSASSFYLVASGASEGTQVQVFQDGVLLTGAAAGKDLVNGILTVKESRLYTIVANPKPGVHTLKLIIKKAGLQAYALTFG